LTDALAVTLPSTLPARPFSYYHPLLRSSLERLPPPDTPHSLFTSWRSRVAWSSSKSLLPSGPTRLLGVASTTLSSISTLTNPPSSDGSLSPGFALLQFQAISVTRGAPGLVLNIFDRYCTYWLRRGAMAQVRLTRSMSPLSCLLIVTSAGPSFQPPPASSPLTDISERMAGLALYTPPPPPPPLSQPGPVDPPPCILFAGVQDDLQCRGDDRGPTCHALCSRFPRTSRPDQADNGPVSWRLVVSYPSTFPFGPNLDQLRLTARDLLAGDQQWRPSRGNACRDLHVTCLSPIARNRLVSGRNAVRCPSTHWRAVRRDELATARCSLGSDTGREIFRDGPRNGSETRL